MSPPREDVPVLRDSIKIPWLGSITVRIINGSMKTFQVLQLSAFNKTPERPLTRIENVDMDVLAAYLQSIDPLRSPASVTEIHEFFDFAEDFEGPSKYSEKAQRINEKIWTIIISGGLFDSWNEELSIGTLYHNLPEPDQWRSIQSQRGRQSALDELWRLAAFRGEFLFLVQPLKPEIRTLPARPEPRTLPTNPGPRTLSTRSKLRTVLTKPEARLVRDKHVHFVATAPAIINARADRPKGHAAEARPSALKESIYD